MQTNEKIGKNRRKIEEKNRTPINILVEKMGVLFSLYYDYGFLYFYANAEISNLQWLV